MNVTLVRQLSEVSDFDPKDPNKEIVTRDGGRLVSISISGITPVEVITKLMAVSASVAKSLPRGTKDMYIFYGNIDSNVKETKYTMVIGASGVTNMEEIISKIVHEDSNKSEEKEKEAEAGN